MKLAVQNTQLVAEILCIWNLKNGVIGDLSI